jgi:hypothetical protein
MFNLGMARAVVLLVVVFAALVIAVISLVDAWARPEKAFTAEGKRSKKFWLLVLGVGVFFGFFFTLFGVNGPFWAVLPAAPGAIYWYSVRPAIKPYGTKRR